MSCYNGEEFIAESIDSVLSQTFTNFELIIINDGSTDKSSSIIKSYDDSRIVFLDFDINKGLIDCLNVGIVKANGKYIARFDADDICYSDRIERQVQFLECNDDVAVVGTYANVIDENGVLSGVSMKPELDDADIRAASCFYCRFIHPSVMIRRSILIDNELRYSHNAIHSEDYALWSEIAQYGKLANIPFFGIKYREHSSNISKVYSTEQIANSSKARLAFLVMSGYPCKENHSDSLVRLFSDSQACEDDLLLLASIHEHLKKSNLPISGFYFWRLCCFNAKSGFSIFKLYMKNQVISRSSLFQIAVLFVLTLFKINK